MRQKLSSGSKITIELDGTDQIFVIGWKNGKVFVYTNCPDSNGRNKEIYLKDPETIKQIIDDQITESINYDKNCFYDDKIL